MKEELLVLGKTYPTISKKYELLVCVAGITANGEWRRIYPIPWKIFWKYSESKFKKKQWIRYELRDNKPSDRRPESRKIKFDTIEVLHEESFRNIKKILDERLNTLEELQEKKDTEISLGVVRPKIIDIIWDDWDYYKEIDKLIKQQTTLDITDGVKKSPVNIDFPDKKFQIIFKCNPDCPKEHKMMCEDWEIGMLYLNVLKRHKDKEKACNIVRDKILKLQKDHKYIYFGIGTHNKFGTWLIGSILYPKKEELKEIETTKLSDFLKFP